MTHFLAMADLGSPILSPKTTKSNSFVLFFHRFRTGFKQAFSCCPCVPHGSYEGLELKSTRYLQSQTSVYKASRTETTVSTVLHLGDEVERPKVKATGGKGSAAAAAAAAAAAGARQHSSSLDLTSNGSSVLSVSKTVSETSSFYSSNNML